MKRKAILLIVALGFGFPTALPVRGAVLVREAFDNFQIGARPSLWSFTNCNADSDTYTIADFYGNFGDRLPSLRLPETGSIVTTPFLNEPQTLSFWFRGYYGSCSGSFLVKRYDGLSWNQVTYISNPPGFGTTVGPVSIDPSTLRLQFSWLSGMYGCPLALDDILVAGGATTPSPIPTATPTRAPPTATPTLTPVPTASPTAPPSAGPISGRVYDRNTGVGLSGVLVVATGTLGGRNATTNSSGNYSISGLPVGTYRVEARPPGIPPSNPAYVSQYYSQVYTWDGALWVPTNNSGIDFPLVKGGAISGVVVDQNTGVGLPDMTIAGYDSLQKQLHWTRSGSGGAFTLRPFLTGEYRIFVSTDYSEIIHPWCYDDQWFDQEHTFAFATIIPVTQGSTISGIDISLLECQPPPSPPPSPPPPSPTPPGVIEIYQVWSGVPGTLNYGKGTGQATLIYEPASGTTILYDCGGTISSSPPLLTAAREVLYLMESLGLDHIDYLIISHYDADHYMGVPYLFNGTQRPEDDEFVRNGLNAQGGVGAVLDRGGLYKADGTAIDAAYLAAVAGVRQTWSIGAEIDLGIPGGPALLKCLALGNPDDTPVSGGDLVHVYNHADLTITCTADPAENAKSIVSLLSYGGFDMWIGGDTSSSLGSPLCAPVEETVGQVIHDDLQKCVDILLVDHHGSQYHTSPAFLNWICPSVAIISVWNNSYGFPTQPVCSRLSGKIVAPNNVPTILQTSDGDGVCYPRGFSARTHIHAWTDSNSYTLTTDDANGRATAWQSLTEVDTGFNWQSHPVCRDPCPTPTPQLRHLLISQMAAAGPGGSKDEFVEIYNASDGDIDIGGWKLQYRTASCGTKATRATVPSGVNLPQYRFYLFGCTGYSGPVAADAVFDSGASESGGHWVIADETDADKDKVGWGSAACPEGAPASVPAWLLGETLMRKVSSHSTAQSMCPAGSEYGYGNAYDSDNNQFDFVVQNVCDRQVIRNSNSDPWPPAPPTPTPRPIVPLTRVILDSGDYRGDGTSEIALFRPAGGLWSVRNFTRLFFGSSFDLPASGDYNGDGSADFALFRGDQALWAVRGVTRLYFGEVADIPCPGDYNGDGSTDAAVYRKLEGLWAIKDIGRFNLGGAADLPVPRDFNGDGSTDVAIFRSYYGLWSIRDLTRLYFGGGIDAVPVPADYNGDAASEVAVFRSYYGQWDVQGITRLYFGTDNDYPLPADYTGSGSDQIGIFRPFLGFWSIKDLTSLYFGSSADIPVVR